MSEEVTVFIESLNQPWQVEECNRLRKMIVDTIPNTEQRMQYRKPHFLKNGKYAAVISPSKDAVNFMIFNAEGIEFPEGFEGPPERKTIKIRESYQTDYGVLGSLLAQASSSL